MTELTGTSALARAILRRDRVRIAVWTVAIAGLVVITAASVKLGETSAATSKK